MQSSWRHVRVGDIGKVVTGKTPSTTASENFGGSYPFITIPDLGTSPFVSSTARTLSEQGAALVKSSKLPAGAVLMSCIATVGKRGITTRPSFTNQQINAVVCGPEVKPLFLYYAFAELAKILDSSGAGGSVFANVSKGRFADLTLLLPPLVVQDSIATLLATIDSRIDLLRQTNATLESIAQALFKSWFIDFDPVRAKAEGREPEGMDAATAALFPAEFEESALGLIPRGWRAIPFAETVSIMGGGTPKTSVPEFWGGDIPWFSVVDAPGGGQVFTMRTEKSITSAGVDNSSTRVLPAWTTIISARGTVGKLAMTARPMAMNQSCYGLGPRIPGTEPFVYLAAQRLVDDLKRLAHGGVFDTITRDTLSSVSIVQAPPDVQSAVAAMVKPVFEKIQQGVERISVLTELRDTLLPRLISGKLRLPEAQEQVEEAVA